MESALKIDYAASFWDRPQPTLDRLRGLKKITSSFLILFDQCFKAEERYISSLNKARASFELAIKDVPDEVGGFHIVLQNFETDLANRIDRHKQLKNLFGDQSQPLLTKWKTDIKAKLKSWTQLANSCLSNYMSCRESLLRAEKAFNDRSEEHELLDIEKQKVEVLGGSAEQKSEALRKLQNAERSLEASKTKYSTAIRSIQQVESEFFETMNSWLNELQQREGEFYDQIIALLSLYPMLFKRHNTNDSIQKLEDCLSNFALDEDRNIFISKHASGAMRPMPAIYVPYTPRHEGKRPKVETTIDEFGATTVVANTYELTAVADEHTICTVLFDWEAENEGDLALVRGDEILLLSKNEHDDPDWWLGQSQTTGRKGMFPRVYVRIGDLSEATAGSSLKALFDFAAEGPNELTITAHEVLEVLEPEKDDWILCKNSLGASGYVPVDYVQLE
ncbi:hypothetical protein PCE1_004141 [Barthelona sp. PCE]